MQREVNYMKVVAFNGSQHAKGNTWFAIRMVLDELESCGIETEIVHVGVKPVRGCMACFKCAKNRDEKCVLDDDVNEWLQKIKAADGIILGSPVHYSGIQGTMKSFLDRAFFVAGFNRQMFRHKVGASVAAVRRSGGLPTINQLNHYLSYSEMFVATSNYWPVIHGSSAGDVEQDAEGKQIMRVLGKNMAWLIQTINASNVPVPEPEKKIITNFIR
jgi:multimeric flavodoxin WrbA